MTLVIAGTRTFEIPISTVNGLIIAFDLKPTQVVYGSEHGVDWTGRNWAIKNGIHPIPVLAEWEKHGDAAGPMRNKEMAEKSDALLLIWNGTSTGSANMKHEMEKLSKPVYEVVLRFPPEQESFGF